MVVIFNFVGSQGRMLQFVFIDKLFQLLMLFVYNSYSYEERKQTVSKKTAMEEREEKREE